MHYKGTDRQLRTVVFVVLRVKCWNRERLLKTANCKSDKGDRPKGSWGRRDLN